MNDKQERMTLTVPQLAARWGFGIEAVRKMAKSGTVPSLHVGTKYVFPIRAIEEYETEIGKRVAARE